MTDESSDIARLLELRIEEEKPSYIALGVGADAEELVIRANRSGLLCLARELVNLATNGGVGSHITVDEHTLADEAASSLALTVVMHVAPWEAN